MCACVRACVRACVHLESSQDKLLYKYLNYYCSYYNKNNIITPPPPPTHTHKSKSKTLWQVFRRRQLLAMVPTSSSACLHLASLHSLKLRLNCVPFCLQLRALFRKLCLQFLQQTKLLSALSALPLCHSGHTFGGGGGGEEEGFN